MLRTLILFAIFLNLAFFYWVRETNFDREVWSHPRAVGNYAPIRLLSELDDTHSISKDDVADDIEINSRLMCFSIGPFDDSDSSDEMYDVLFGLGIQAQQRIVNERKPKSYWVYLPSENSKAKADETVEFLNKNNVDETYIWQDKPHKYDVSLGLFSKLSIANAKIAEIEKLDLNPNMEVRYSEVTEFWVDYQHDIDRPQPQQFEELFRDNQRLLIIESNCS